MTLDELRTRVWARLDEDADSPLRWTRALITEYLNDGVRDFSARAQLKTATATITQTTNKMDFELPADCIRIIEVLDDQNNYILRATSLQELDAGGSLGDPGLPPSTELRRRWGLVTAPYATNYFVWDKKIYLWPMSTIADVPVTSFVNFDETKIFTAAAATYTMTATPYDDSSVAMFRNGLHCRLLPLGTATTEYEYEVLSGVITPGVAFRDGDVIVMTTRTADGELKFTDLNGGFFLDAVTSGGEEYVILTDAAGGFDSTTSDFALFINGLRFWRVADDTSSDDLTAMQCSYSTTLSTDNAKSFVIREEDVGVGLAQPVLACWLHKGTTQVHLDDQFATTDSGAKTYALTNLPPDDGEVAIFASGVRLRRVTKTVPVPGEFSIEGKMVTLGHKPLLGEFLIASYGGVASASPNTYTVKYLQDLGTTAMTVDADEPDIPEQYHTALVDYCVARCLILNAHGERIQKATDLFGKYTAIRDSAADRTRVRNKDWARDSSPGSVY